VAQISSAFGFDRSSIQTEGALLRLMLEAAFGPGWSLSAPSCIGYSQRSLFLWLDGASPVPKLVIERIEAKLLQRLAAFDDEERQRGKERREMLARALTAARVLQKGRDYVGRPSISREAVRRRAARLRRLKARPELPLRDKVPRASGVTIGAGPAMRCGASAKAPKPEG
jgi:hypothetical protein